jgi:enolase-phosphatase E1
MSKSLSYPDVQVVLLDIEGTTTSVKFVFEVLFPYARREVQGFLEKHLGEESIDADIDLLRQEHLKDLDQGLDPPRWEETRSMESIVSYFRWLMDHDRKSTGMKSLQGKIWKEGYRAGALHGQVYPDVPTALERWRRQDRFICIYSSGSVLAQKLLFSTTDAGDLTPFFRAHFDTTTGPKKQERSYLDIADVLTRPPSKVLFLSDVEDELDAARLAGMKTGLCVREGASEPQAATHPVIHSFNEVFP